MNPRSISDLPKVTQAMIGIAMFCLQSKYFISFILECFKADIYKVLVSRMILKSWDGKPDMALRNNQKLIEYHFNIFMSYKVPSDMENMIS